MLMVLSHCLPANNGAIGEFIAVRSPCSFLGTCFKFSSIFLAMLPFGDLRSLTKPGPPAVEAQSPSNWTAREFLQIFSLLGNLKSFKVGFGGNPFSIIMIDN